MNSCRLIQIHCSYRNDKHELQTLSWPSICPSSYCMDQDMLAILKQEALITIHQFVSRISCSSR